MVSIGSKKPNAKEINISFNKKHLFVGFVVFIVVVMYYTFVSSPFLYEYVTCENGTKEVLHKNNTHICGLSLPYNMETKKQVEYYNNYMENEKWKINLTQ